VEALFERKEPFLYPLFQKLQKEIKRWKGVEWSATENCVVYIAQTTFLIIKPMKSCLELKFSLAQARDAFPVYKAEAWGKRVWHRVRLYEADDLDEAVWSLLKQSYKEDTAARKR
jgi:hypothetical protein